MLRATAVSVAVLGSMLVTAAVGQGATVPDFGPNSATAWIPARPAGDDFYPPDSGPGPVMSDKEHPYVPNGQGRVSYRVADLSNQLSVARCGGLSGCDRTITRSLSMMFDSFL